jgi:hypothetical protein
VSLLSQGRTIAVFIAGREALSCRDPMPLPPGHVAFGCRQGEGVAFDDILLTSLEKPESEGREPERPMEPQPREMEPPPPPEPETQTRENEPPLPPEPKPREPEPPRPPEPKPQEPEPPRPPEPKPQEPQPPSQPQPTHQLGRVSPQPGPVNINGSWRSSRDVNYRISQKGDQFTWEAPAIAERGSGKINGRSVTASWSGRMGSGSARGTVEVAADGRATAIRWDNGTILRKQN